jgi:hypothetical protein
MSRPAMREGRRPAAHAGLSETCGKSPESRAPLLPRSRQGGEVPRCLSSLSNGSSDDQGHGSALIERARGRPAWPAQMLALVGPRQRPVLVVLVVPRQRAASVAHGGRPIEFGKNPVYVNYCHKSATGGPIEGGLLFGPSMSWSRHHWCFRAHQVAPGSTAQGVFTGTRTVSRIFLASRVPRSHAETG